MVWFTRLLVVLLLLSGLAVIALAAAPKITLPEKYDRWLNQDVTYIISDEERKEFLALKADAERERYIAEFWEARNPLRGSPRNPFKEEHYARIQYANEHFGRSTNTPGWKTDMGRTWIVLGKPESQQPFKGYGQIYPLELWFYQNKTGITSLPPFFNVLFFMPEDIGEYRFYHPIMDGPMKLVRGSQFQTNRDVYKFLQPLGGDVARAVLSLSPSEPIDTDAYSPNMSGEIIVSKIQNLPNDSFELQRVREARYLRARVQSWFMAIQDKPLEVSTAVFSDPAGGYWLDYALLIDDEKLGRPSPDGRQLLVNCGFRLLGEKGDLIIEDSEERAFPAYEGSGGERRFQPFLLASRIPLAAGKYRVEVLVSNREASRGYRAEHAVEVPEAGAISLGSPLLAAKVEPAARADPAAPFQYYGAQFLPAAGRLFSRRAPLRLLYQVHAPEGETRVLQVEYLLAHAQLRDLRRTFSDTLRPEEFKNGALLKSKTIELGELEPGDYRLVVTVKAEGSAQVLSSFNLPLQLGEGAAQPAFFVLSNSRAMAAPAMTAYIRALESLSRNDETAATAFLGQSLEVSPGNPAALRALIPLYYRGRQFDRLAELYARLGPDVLNSAPEIPVQIALSFWHTGQAEKAKRVLESASTFFPGNTLLAAARKQVDLPLPSRR